MVSIGFHANEDPQQIFESLNATGRPLTESEKVKNWLLMGLPDAEQQDLHDNHWRRIRGNAVAAEARADDRPGIRHEEPAGAPGAQPPHR